MTFDGFWNDIVATPYQITVQSDDYGEYETLGAGSITTLGTSATELIACNNSLAIARARGIESDFDLIRRMSKTRRLYGGTSAKSLEQRIMNDIPNVSFCRVLENNFNAPLRIDENLVLPPKCIFPIIEGGSSYGITNWMEKYIPASCIAYGTDFQAVRQVNDPVTKQSKWEVAYGWNRPKPRYIDLKIEILQYSSDNPFPVNGHLQIKQEILNWFYGRYPIGENFNLKDLFTPINRIIGSAAVKITQRNTKAVNGYKDILAGTTVWSDQNIELWDEYAYINDIQVV
jgi:hypothetical protein